MPQTTHSPAPHPQVATHPASQTHSHAPHPHHRPIHSGMVLTGLSLAILLSQLGTNIINVALPTLVKDLGVEFGSVQWVVVSYLLVVTALTRFWRQKPFADVEANRVLAKPGASGEFSDQHRHHP